MRHKTILVYKYKDFGGKDDYHITESWKSDRIYKTATRMIPRDCSTDDTSQSGNGLTDDMIEEKFTYWKSEIVKKWLFFKVQNNYYLKV